MQADQDEYSAEISQYNFYLGMQALEISMVHNNLKE
jgi:hypothetical protein